jgi:HAD superfamily phosphoserine phosphatase-like hydrolase
MENIKLVCFDVDETLVDGISWWMLTEALGCSLEKAFNIFNQAREGKISFREGEKLFAKMFQESGNATREFIDNFFESIDVKPGAKDLIFYLKQKGYLIYLISGGIDIYVNSIARKLKVDGFYSNSSLEFDKKRVLQGIHYRENQKVVKVEQLQELIRKIGIDMNNVVFIGDSENDIDVFKATKQGIAVSTSDEELKKVSWKTVNSLSEIKNIL